MLPFFPFLWYFIKTLNLIVNFPNFILLYAIVKLATILLNLDGIQNEQYVLDGLEPM